MSILVLEDNDDLRELISSWINYLGHDVFAAENLSKAFKILEKNAISIILSDYNLGIDKPHKLIEEYKAQCKIILVTGEEESNITCHYDELITKPFHTNDLDKVILKYQKSGKP